MAREVDGDIAEAVERRIGGPLAPDPLEKVLRALDRPDDALIVERLEEIVERLNLEGVHGVLFEGGDEHDRGRTLVVYGRGDREAVEVGHLDIQEHQVGRAAAQQLHRIAAVRALVDVRDTADLLQHTAQAASRGRFVVNDDRAHDRSRGCRSPPMRRRERERWSARIDDWDRTAPEGEPGYWPGPVPRHMSCR